MKNIILSSSEPVTDGGRKYNGFYLVGVAVGFIVGVSIGGFGSGIFISLLGTLFAWILKNEICHFKTMGLRDMTFFCSQKIPYSQLIQSLQPILLPLNMTIEKGTEGNPIISYKGVLYDVSYNQDDTFSVWWRMSVVRAFLSDRFYISLYRKTSVAYGIVAYNIQRLCNSDQNNSAESENVMPEQTKSAQQHVNFSVIGEKNKKKKITGIVAISIIFILIVSAVSGIWGNEGEKEYVNYVKEGYPESYPYITYGQAFNDFFGDPEWKYFKSSDENDIVEFSGKCTYMDAEVTATIQFVLDIDNGTFVPGYFDMNGVPQNEWMTLFIINKVFDSYGKENVDRTINEEAETVELEEDTQNTVLESTKLVSAEYTCNKPDDCFAVMQLDGENLTGSVTIFSYGGRYIMQDDIFDLTENESGYEAYFSWLDESFTISNITDAGFDVKDATIMPESLEGYYSRDLESGGELPTEILNLFYTESEYLVPNSDSVYLEESYFEDFTDDELRLARNEIYARHGRRFANMDIQAYFDAQAWYTPYYDPEEFDEIQDQLLNDIEKANAATIAKVESKR